MIINQQNSITVEILEYLKENPQELEKNYSFFLKNSGKPQVNSDYFNKKFYQNLMKPQETYEGLPFELALAKLPWAKQISNGESPECFDRALFTNIYEDLPRFKQVIAQEDFASVFKVTNRALKRALYETSYLLYRVGSEEFKIYDFTKFETVRCLMEFYPFLDQQLLLPLKDADNHELRLNLKAFLSLYEDARSFLDLAPNPRVVISGLLEKDRGTLIWDTRSMMMSLLEKKEIRILGKSFETKKLVRDLFNNASSLKKIHNKLMIYCEQEEGSVNLQPREKYLQGKKVKDKTRKEKNVYEIHIPMTTQELTQAGRFLNICVGNGSYENKIIKNISNILFLKQNGRIKYCVEYKYKQIIQIKTVNNESGFHLEKPLQSILRGVPVSHKIKEFAKNPAYLNLLMMTSLWSVFVGFCCWALSS